MAKQDKKLVLALLAAVGVFGATQLLIVRANFADAAKSRDDAGAQRKEWDKYFKPAEKSASEKWSRLIFQQSKKRTRQLFLHYGRTQSRLFAEDLLRHCLPRLQKMKMALLATRSPQAEGRGHIWRA